MQKKVFLIILPIAFLAFYGCSSMKHSTIVLYVSHKVEGPLYMPEPEPPVSTQAPQTQNASSPSQKESAQTSQGKKPARGSQTTSTSENQANQNNQPAQASQGSGKPAKEQTSTENKANQSEPAQTSQDKKPTSGSKASQSQDSSKANQNNQPAQASQGNAKPTRENQPSSATENKATQESKPSRENQSTTKKPSRESKDSQNQITNTYGDYTMRTLPRGEFLVLEKPIRFAFEKYYIGSSYNDTVQYVADFMKQNTNFQLVVEGHTDRVGEYKFNKNLSLKRSRAAIQKLVRAGVPKNRLIESGVSYRFSEYNFNRLNRRVEFIIIRSPEDITNYREGIK